MSAYNYGKHLLYYTGRQEFSLRVSMETLKTKIVEEASLKGLLWMGSFANYGV